MKTPLRELVFLLTLLLFPAAVAPSPADLLAPFFAGLEDKGTPIAGYAWKDSTAAVDVLSSGKVTRYSFDAAGNVTTAPSPLAVDPKRFAGLKFAAADAARAAASANYPKNAFIRAVFPRSGDAATWFVVAAYDKSGKFLGTHLYNAADGSYEGWTDAVGEIDPLSREKTK